MAHQAQKSSFECWNQRFKILLNHIRYQALQAKYTMTNSLIVVQQGSLQQAECTVIPHYFQWIPLTAAYVLATEEISPRELKVERLPLLKKCLSLVFAQLLTRAMQTNWREKMQSVRVQNRKEASRQMGGECFIDKDIAQAEVVYRPLTVTI